MINTIQNPSNYEKPNNIEDLKKFNSPKGREVLLLKHNSVFYQTILNTIAAKNKLDFPPLGPTSDESKEFQNEKIKYLLQAIMDKETSPIGDKVNYPLASTGIFQVSVQGARTLGSKGKAFGRSLKGLLGYTRTGGKKVKKDKVKKDKVKKEKVKKTK